VVSVIAGGLLAWWQWDRYQSATGTLQNLGYVLQWPLFGVFPAFMFYRISQAAKRAKEADALAEAAQAQVPQPRVEQPGTEPAERASGPTMSADEWIAKRAYVQKRISSDVAPDDEDQVLLAYNQRLAQLSAEERHAG
jgi:DNA-binding transcriptional regulator of glucitol operon